MLLSMSLGDAQGDLEAIMTLAGAAESSNLNRSTA
jgi:hypothetical protein